MSRCDNCWNNAPTESFLPVSRKRGSTALASRPGNRPGARSSDGSKVWYNRKRRHSTLGDISPEAFERKHQQVQAEAMAAQASSLPERSRDASEMSYTATASICHPCPAAVSLPSPADRLGERVAFSEGFARFTGHSHDARQRSLEHDDRAGASASLGGSRRDAKFP